MDKTTNPCNHALAHPIFGPLAAEIREHLHTHDSEETDYRVIHQGLPAVVIEFTFGGTNRILIINVTTYGGDFFIYSQTYNHNQSENHEVHHIPIADPRSIDKLLTIIDKAIETYCNEYA
jgi:hypothetical protein